MYNTSMLVLFLFIYTGCAQVEPDPMNDKAIKVMKSMRNPVCRQVGSYLYCNEQ